MDGERKRKSPVILLVITDRTQNQGGSTPPLANKFQLLILQRRLGCASVVRFLLSGLPHSRDVWYRANSASSLTPSSQEMHMDGQALPDCLKHSGTISATVPGRIGLAT